ncbi:MAG: septal ring lytic transglycosylase RlpA family protein [Alphaproteobacteria bacterium]|nr:septal ring lytic transglycosylase RlpA family protein [Alphaproteobacteria bacterium]
MVPIILSGCTQIELASHFGKKITNSSAQSVGMYKVGSPYTIGGMRYYPAIDYNYDKTGIASWYGPNFHGKKTANGEIYDQNGLTAAHKTLPLPSIVRVTNLENGRSLIVRVNDRGPYAHGRVIDMSKRSAELLGFRIKGISKVRVQVLEAESRQMAKIAKNGHGTNGMEVPMNSTTYKSPLIKTASMKTQNVQHHASLTNLTTAKIYPVISPPRIFVQTGAFSTRETAMKYASALDQYGHSQISSVIVKGEKYYRVRFPAKDVATAGILRGRLVQNGYKNALIIVD